MEVFSQSRGLWFQIPDVLADTGATVSLMPLHIGKGLVGDLYSGQKVPLGGIVPKAKIFGWMHKLRIRIKEIELRIPAAIVPSDDVPLILGRKGALDRLNVLFSCGKKIVITQLRNS
ncbi:MAG: hypothetical protein HY747_06600 [Elusimicrobia bacterium]|nr:hypothetical protein [Elusimicrobiota bacterium]